MGAAASFPLVVASAAAFIGSGIFAFLHHTRGDWVSEHHEQQAIALLLFIAALTAVSAIGDLAP